MTAVSVRAPVRPLSANPPRKGGVGKVAAIVGGWALIVASPFVGILPGPGGIPVFLAGAVLVLKNSPASRRAFARAHKRWPKQLGPVRTLLKTREPLKLSMTWASDTARGVSAFFRGLFIRRPRQPA